MKNLLILTGLPLLLWAVLLYPGWLLFGDPVVLHSGVALALCLLPALATMAFAQRRGLTPEGRMLAGLGSSGVRMGIALGIGFLLFRQMPDRFPLPFLYWLLIFYLTILGLEVGLLVRQARTVTELPEA